MNKTIRINISKNGFFLGNERLNMLEYQFNEIRLRNNFYIVESNTSPGANCVICYDFKPKKRHSFLSWMYGSLVITSLFQRMTIKS